MEFKKLKDTVCPHCQSRVIEETCRSFHTNGEGNERRLFECGQDMRWSPNAGRILVDHLCSKHPDEVKRKEQERAAKQKLLEFVKTLDANDDWKQNVERHFQYI